MAKAMWYGADDSKILVPAEVGLTLIMDLADVVGEATAPAAHWQGGPFTFQ